MGSETSALKSIKDQEVVDVIYNHKDQQFHPSPEAWEDQLMYFFLPDRFSDGKEGIGGNVEEGATPLFGEQDRDNALKDKKSRPDWYEAGKRFLGGSIKGATTKLGYLKRMGITAIWIGPVFKQIARLETYHGYAIQDFLAVDPRFGTKEDLKEFVKAAHDEGIYVLMDIVLNHAGDVFAYSKGAPYYTPEEKKVKGFWDRQRHGDEFYPMEPIDEKKYPNAYPDGAVWPRELQTKDSFMRKGFIRDMDAFPEFVDGDFFELKKVNLGSAEDYKSYVPRPALQNLCEVYKFWIAFADIDGYRIDTVRHMGDGPTKYFSSVIHEYAYSLGKKNFYLIGEISGTNALRSLRRTQIDAILGIDEVQKALWSLPLGRANPIEYFSLFKNTAPEKSQSMDGYERHQVVTMIDDHDQTWRGDMKGRFCSEKKARLFDNAALHVALGLNLLSIGIPCLYSGTEQAFDGSSEKYIGTETSYADRFIREAMFGGRFGAFGSHYRHFFNESSPTYRCVQNLALLRQKEPALRRGSQYLRPVSHNGIEFDYPGANRKMGAVVAWSRIYDGTEILCIMSSHAALTEEVWIAVDDNLHNETREVRVMQCIYPPGSDATLEIVTTKKGHKAVKVTVPPHSLAVYKQLSMAGLA